VNIKKQMAEMYGLPYKPPSTFILLKKWQEKRRAALKRYKKRKNKEKE
jgi:hypothetical protein